jgi:hypothetical protein
MSLAFISYIELLYDRFVENATTAKSPVERWNQSEDIGVERSSFFFVQQQFLKKFFKEVSQRFIGAGEDVFADVVDQLY